MAVGVQLWRHAMNFTAEVVLEGIAKAGSRGKCTPMGRAAMSLDLQVILTKHILTLLRKVHYDERDL